MLSIHSLPPSLIHSATQQGLARCLLRGGQAPGEAQAAGSLPCGAHNTRRQTKGRAIRETSMQSNRMMTDSDAAFLKAVVTTAQQSVLFGVSDSVPSVTALLPGVLLQTWWPLAVY